MKNSRVVASKVTAERLQTRANTNSEYIDDIAERMAAGDEFPDIVVFTDGNESWLADGIHRLDGAIKAKKTIGIEERKGTRADAIEFACGANIAHGLRRTKADKRRSVTLALTAFPDHSSRAIAAMCGVGDHLVEEIRGASTRTCIEKPEKTRVGRDGKRQPAQKQPTPKPAPDESKPAKAGQQVGDPRLWDRWQDTFGKLRRLADDLNRNFPHHNNHKAVVEHINAAFAIADKWRKGK